MSQNLLYARLDNLLSHASTPGPVDLGPLEAEFLRSRLLTNIRPQQVAGIVLHDQDRMGTQYVTRVHLTAPGQNLRYVAPHGYAALEGILPLAPNHNNPEMNQLLEEVLAGDDRQLYEQLTNPTFISIGSPPNGKTTWLLLYKDTISGKKLAEGLRIASDTLDAMQAGDP